ncbi:MAG: hypothetical protein IPM79_33615 [Polyangiaceae bacterium]|nr:hypothetical protein [Polyangiaceae bacterium]
MRITGTGSSRVMSLDLEAPSAEAAGASSLGLLVSEATVELEAVAITAGDGAAGAPPAQVEQLARAQGGMTGAVAGTVGSSLGIVSLNATLTLGDGVTVTGSGGAGGAGGMGQLGQLGGFEGDGGAAGGTVVDACDGGSGGAGGHGGNGGGGRGGHAVGIAYVGAEPAGGTVDVGGSSEGVGGPGGDNGLEPGGAGADGVVEERLEL